MRTRIKLKAPRDSDMRSSTLILSLLLLGVTAPASAKADRVGLHVFIVSSKMGQISVDQDVIGPFSGTVAAAAREEAKLRVALEQKGLTISRSPTVYVSGQCIGVFKNPKSTTFSIIYNPRVDLERRENSEYYRKNGITLQHGPFCI